MIENTADRDPLLHLLDAISSPDTFITDMEAAGQRQVVASSLLPTEGDWEKAEALGVVRGAVVSGDPLFTEATLPEGWTKGATGHDMYSDVLDTRGIRRISIGYKAAFYDRWARFTVLPVGATFASDLIYGEGDPEIPASWERLTLDEQLDAVRELGRARAHDLEYAEKSRSLGRDDSYYTEKVERIDTVLALLDKSVA